MKKILVVEDDDSIHSILESILKQEGYEVINAYSGTETMLVLEREEVDLIILDLMLPGLNGEEIIKKVNHKPIIVLSAKASKEDKVNCLLSGANDYITKPFDKDELLARVKVQLRLNKENRELAYDELKLLNDKRTLMIGKNRVSLTKTEYAILKQLMLNTNEVVTKSRLLELISIDTLDCDESSLRVHISNIRKKIKKYSEREYIESVWGVGFKIKS